MKKKFLTFLLAICLIIPCMFMLTACGEKAKFNVNINIFINGTQTELKDGVQEIRLVDASNYSSNEYTDFPVISKDIGISITEFAVIYTFCMSIDATYVPSAGMGLCHAEIHA